MIFIRIHIKLTFSLWKKQGHLIWFGKKNPQKPYSGSMSAEMKVFLKNIYLTKIPTHKGTSDKVRGPLCYFMLYQSLSSCLKNNIAISKIRIMFLNHGLAFLWTIFSTWLLTDINGISYLHPDSWICHFKRLPLFSMAFNIIISINIHRSRQ